MDLLTTYDADPRAEELQLLRQINRQTTCSNHSATVATAHRLQERGEAMMWPWKDGYAIEATAKGRRTIGVTNGSQATTSPAIT